MPHPIQSTGGIDAYRQQLAIVVSQGMIGTALIVAALGSLRLFWRTIENALAQIILLALILLCGWVSLRQSRQGRTKATARIVMSAGIVMSTFIIVAMSRSHLLYSSAVLCLFVLISTLIDSSGHMLYWGVGSVLAYAGALTLRVLWPIGEAPGPAHLVGLYAIPIPLLLAFYTLGRTISDLFDRTLIDQAKVAQENARLYDQAQRELAERTKAEAELRDRERSLILLNEIARAALQSEDRRSLLEAFVHQLIESFEADGGCLILWDIESQQPATHIFYGAIERICKLVEPEPNEIRLDKAALSAGHVLVVNDARDTPYLSAQLRATLAGRAMLAMPLMAGGQKLGAAILTLKPGASPTPQTVARAEQAASQIALAVNKAQLHEELADHAEQLTASLHSKETMLREIHHRVKNNLQVVSSLLSLQAAQASEPEAVQICRESQSRIRSIALVHEKLYRSPEIEEVSASDYARSLVAFLFRTYIVRSESVDLELDVADLKLGIDVAVPLGLILNELVSNALKHAFPPDRPARNGDRNKLFVGVYPGPKGIELLVRDNGVGFPPGLDPHNTPSLGLQLVSTLVDQLEGTMELERDHGTLFRLHLATPDGPGVESHGPQRRSSISDAMQTGGQDEQP